MTSRRLLLLRHGRTAWNAERRYQGQLNPPLDDTGRMQAWDVAPLIASTRPDLIVSSDAERARQTAEVVAEACRLPLTLEPRLRERSLGHWEGLTRDEVAERYPDEFADWRAGRDVSRRGGESRDEVAARALAAFAELPRVPVTVLVTHSATAMALCTALLGMAQTVHVLGPLANCHWSELIAEEHDGEGGQGGEGGEGGEGEVWRLRAHNLGSPGVVLPLPVRLDAEVDEQSDADA